MNDCISEASTGIIHPGKISTAPLCFKIAGGNKNKNKNRNKTNKKNLKPFRETGTLPRGWPDETRRAIGYQCASSSASLLGKLGWGSAHIPSPYWSLRFTAEVLNGRFYRKEETVKTPSDQPSINLPLGWTTNRLKPTFSKFCILRKKTLAFILDDHSKAKRVRGK